MNEEAQKLLDQILSKPLYEIKSHEIDFLKARIDYIPRKKKEELKDLLQGTGQTAETQPDIKEETKVEPEQNQDEE